MSGRTKAHEELLGSVGSDYHRLVLRVALERVRGKESPWHEWIRALPSLEDYSQFYPFAAGEEVYWDFIALDVVANHLNRRMRLERLYETTQNFFATQPAGTRRVQKTGV